MIYQVLYSASTCGQSPHPIASSILTGSRHNTVTSTSTWQWALGVGFLANVVFMMYTEGALWEMFRAVFRAGALYRLSRTGPFLGCWCCSVQEHGSCCWGQEHCSGQETHSGPEELYNLGVIWNEFEVLRALLESLFWWEHYLRHCLGWVLCLSPCQL